jgi:hypothetical protein
MQVISSLYGVLDINACLNKACRTNAHCVDEIPPSMSSHCKCNDGFVDLTGGICISIPVDTTPTELAESSSSTSVNPGTLAGIIIAVVVVVIVVFVIALIQLNRKRRQAQIHAPDFITRSPSTLHSIQLGLPMHKRMIVNAVSVNVRIGH